MRGESDVVPGASVVEARGDMDDEAHLPTHGEHAADHAVALHWLAAPRGRYFRLPDVTRQNNARGEFLLQERTLSTNTATASGNPSLMTIG